MSTRWRELTITVPRDDAEAWADACLEAGVLSVQAEDADADSPDEQPLYGEPGPGGVLPVSDAPFGWSQTRLQLLVDADSDEGSLLDEASRICGRALPRVEARREVHDQDWVQATQSQFQPIPIGDRLIVVPSWHEAEAAAREDGRLALIVDPGMAFGTGSHPTTHMCLEWLEAHADRLEGRDLLDYGCGSGILAIAAARLGAADVVGVDIDPQAVASTEHNARVNRVHLRAALSSARRPDPADVVVANILSSPLKLLAPLLCSLVRPGGALVLSGVLERQADEVAAHYRAQIPVEVWRARDGWVCLAGWRR